MFFFLRRSKIIVDCLVSDSNILKYSPIEKANQFVPDWWKKTELNWTYPNSNVPQRSVKGCVGIINMFQTGYIIPMWSDLSLTIKNKSYNWSFSDGVSNAEVHPDGQWKTFTDPNQYGHLKLRSPWYLKTKKDISWMCTEPFWSNGINSNYITTSGILDFKYQHSTHVNLLLPLQDNTFVIKHGRPLYHLIPLTEDKTELRYHVVSDAEIKKHHMPGISFDNSYFKTKSIKEKQEKKCPFHWK